MQGQQYSKKKPGGGQIITRVIRGMSSRWSETGSVEARCAGFSVAAYLDDVPKFKRPFWAKVSGMMDHHFRCSLGRTFIHSGPSWGVCS